MRFNFAGIMVFISINCNKILPQKIQKAPQTIYSEILEHNFVWEDNL